jgi:hypothetical protein
VAATAGTAAKKNAISVHRAENAGKAVKAHPTLSEDFPSPYF